MHEGTVYCIMSVEETGVYKMTVALSITIFIDYSNSTNELLYRHWKYCLYKCGPTIIPVARMSCGIQVLSL